MVKVFTTTCGSPPQGYASHRICCLPQLDPVDAPEKADVIMVDWTFHPEFVADEALIQRIVLARRPTVVFDYVECWNAPDVFLTQPHNWPSSTGLARYAALNALAPVVSVYFKREYTRTRMPTDLPYPVYPTDFFTQEFNQWGTPQSEEGFNARPVTVFMCWGYSACDRPLLHAELMRRHFHSLATCPEDIDYMVAEGRKNIAALLYTPHYRRLPIEIILKYQNLAKLSVCVRGASQKCFRHAESCYNSVMAMQQCNVEFAFPWTDKTDCIMLPNLPHRNLNPPHDIDLPAACTAISMALGSDLYPIYLKGFANAQRYRIKSYIDQHWLPILRKHGAWI